jgi:hypothetical protein
MACVQLPPSCLPPGAVSSGGDGSGLVYKCTSTHGKMLQDSLHYGFRIECPVKTLPGPCGNPRSYVRISAMVYNTLEDYKRLADCVGKISWTDEGAFVPK